MRARYYDPQVGRFISEDPAGFGGEDVNLYAYSSNNPIMKIDPSGLWGDEVHGTYSAEDHGWSSPLNPFSTWRHFRSMEDVQPEINIAIMEGDRLRFNSLMHQGQDTFCHYDNGYRWYTGGHIFASVLSWFGIGNSPDDPVANQGALLKMQEWTAQQELSWQYHNEPSISFQGK